ncbi:hypothetical protein C1645_776671, partial [Glomus cerebriforme]
MEKENDSFQSIFRSYHNRISIIEKIFLYAFLIEIIVYAILFLAFLVSTGKFSVNCISLIFVLFPAISGTIMFSSQTILHGLAFLSVNIDPIIIGVSLLYTQNNACSEIPEIQDACYFPKTTIFYTFAVLLLFFLVLFTVFYCIILYYIWKRRVWPLRYRYQYSKNEEIIEMDSVYQLQFPIFHAKMMIIGIWITHYLINIWGINFLLGKPDDLQYINLAVPLNLFTLFYAFLMLKGVRDEKKYMIYIVYFGNICQSVMLYRTTTEFCYEKKVNLQYCFRYDAFFNLLFGLSVMAWILLILSSWNTMRCHGNFGKNLGFYLKYEPTPEVFKNRNFLYLLPFADDHRR